MNDASGRPYDVVVVGAGMTGSVTAGRAAELGCRVLQLDTAEDSTAGGNTTLSGGGLHLARSRFDADPEILRDKILTRSILGRIELIDVVAKTAGQTLGWILEQGVELAPAAPGDIECMLAPIRDLGDVHAWRDAGPQRALRVLQQRFREHGGEIMPATRAVEFARGPSGEIAGVITEDGRRLAANAVMLADGGFQANPELRRRFISPNADRMFLRGAPNSVGDGLLMAESAGAKLLNTEWFYGHILHRDVFENDKLWPWPGLDELLPRGAILVDAHGARLADEGRLPTVIVNAIGRSEDPRGATVIMDEEMWEASAGEWVWGHRAPNPELVERGARLIRADTLEDLAAQAGIDADGLTSTLYFYDTAVANDKASNLPIPRSGTARPLRPPYIALPAVAGISHTMGGAMIDDQMHVLDHDERPIPGLYAAGPGTAGATVGYYGGFSEATTLGMSAAQTIAEERRR
ncbi:MAG TPA: FAD-dependent oxidoreductase [Solirubrobacteraceae bacterium]|nr:FAD-dependent oxidoreductase [Solirubrobacteraceae bacterium]